MNVPSDIRKPRPVNDKPRQDVSRSFLRSGALPWLILGFWFLVQFCLFYQYLRREILWAFPGFWDQTRYLQESYDTYQSIVCNGLPRGLVHAVTVPTPTGNLLCTEAAILYLFLGSSRLTALLVLFGHWIVLQIVAVGTVRWLSGRWSVAVIGLALLLLPAYQFLPQGALTTFQIDFAAYCMFGVLICLVIRSNLFVNRGWGILTGLVASYLILLRFITLVYLGAIGTMFCIVVTTLWLLHRQPTAVHDRERMRLINLLLAGGLALAVCLPVFWCNRQVIHLYYVVGHVTGQEKYVRASEFGVGSRLDSLLYYPRSVWDKHTGPLFRWAAGGLLLVSLLFIGLRRMTGVRAGTLLEADRLDVPLAYGFLSLCLLMPYLVLTIDVSKSPVVGNIFVPSLWAMITLAVVGAARTDGSRFVMAPLAIALFCVAFSYQISRYNEPGRYTRERTDVVHALELHDLIGQKCLELGLQSPVIGVDALSDAFFPGVIAASQWERHQMLLTPRAPYPQSVLAVNEQEVLAGLPSADFVLLTLSGAKEDYTYPFDQSMQALRPKLLEFCDREMLPLRETSLFGRRVRLYFRPSVRLESPYPDWLSEEGVALHGEAAVLRQFPVITLRGPAFDRFHFPNDDRNVSATSEIDGQPTVPIPVTFSETNGQYTLHLFVPPLSGADDSPVTIRLKFNRYFVPKELGINGDTRHLAVRPPDSLHLERQEQSADAHPGHPAPGLP
jgi:hypothetical protein